MKEIFKKTAAATMSLAIIGSAMPISYSGLPLIDTAITAEAESGTITNIEIGTVLKCGDRLNIKGYFANSESSVDMNHYWELYYCDRSYYDDIYTICFHYDITNAYLTLPIPYGYENVEPIGIRCIEIARGETPEEDTYYFELAYQPKVINFDANGGTGTMDSVELEAYNEYYDLPDCGFTPPEGKVFDCWDCGYPGDSMYLYETESTVTAQWRDQKTIRFNANGGSGIMDDIVLAEDTETYDLPDCTFTPPEGMVFDCWQNYGYPGDWIWLNNGINEVTAQWKEKEVAFISNSMTLGGSISLNFFVDFANVPDDYLDDAYVEFTVGNKTQIAELDRSKMNKAKTAYGFTCVLNSISMADQIQATLYYYDKYGNDAELTTYATAEEYLNKFNEKDPEKTWNLIQGINDYGYYMQQYLSVHSANPWTINWDHIGMAKAYRTSIYFTSKKNRQKYLDALAEYEKKENFTSDIAAVSQAIALDSDTSLILRVKLNEEYKGNVTFTVDGKKATATRQSDGRYKIVIPKISAHKLATEHTLKITTTAGTSVFQASALSYAYACLKDPLDDTEVKAMSAFYEYYLATIAYKSSAT